MATGDKLATLDALKAVNDRAGVTGVKGNAENSYRNGNVNLTPADIGALAPGDVVNNLTSGGASVPLSAEMGKTLGGRLRIGASERLAYSQTVPANGTLDITLANRATDYSLLVLGKNSYVNNTREGFDGRNNIFIAPGGISATSVYAPLIPPDGSWTAWFLSNTSLHVVNGTASDIVFRVDGIR